ncbi:NAD(P)H-quinone oxidoreductase [Herbiconiux ginsengi]|uniref:Putative NAD(P)H quinone oxidoreductase, PIG3 family n=1 Tax=Herbiconiux ginsengi TaxID=381665 RepID=A0A1H3QJU1_9MICO|nr:NAD(P)H-quinone oxidoreductase [Herbiconiux ginsengi]SDZ13298.1 putative NAD(P)H quinone oxidoreductase, PIG3 family [Herbiconiux ginsengi]
MKAVVIREPGDASVLEIGEVPDPVPGEGEVLIDVVAAGVNRADVSQRQGHYPPPPGSPAWPGLEVSGVIAELGPGAADGGFAVGDRVCALLGGGGYAERVAVPAGQVLPVPKSVDLVEAAGLPEVVATVWSNVFLLADLRAGETLLVHGGSSGIGTMAVQLGRAFGARVAVTARSAEKLEACRELGADILIDYTQDDFVRRIKDEAGGADVILDVVGGDYLDRNVRALNVNGRIANISSLGGGQASLDLNALMMKRGTIRSTSLRARPAAEKAEIIASVRENVWPLVENGGVRPVIGARFPLAQASGAHRLMESSEHVGKILLVV